MTAKKKPIKPQSILQLFFTFDVVNDRGELTVPVFSGEWAVKLGNMAKTVYAETKGLAEEAEMKNILGMATQAQREMFLHYEIRYAVLTLLLQRIFMMSADDFTDSEKSSPADVGNLVFLIREAFPAG